MSIVQIVGDSNAAGGVVTGSVQGTVFINGRLVAVNGSPVSPHFPFVFPHVGTVTTSGAAQVRINGIPVNRVGDPDSCGHPRSTQSCNVDIA